MTRTVRTLLLTCLLLLPAAARARELAPPDSALGRPHRHAARAHAADSTRFLPRWLRPWVGFGGDWMAGPAFLKPNYEASQGFGAGLEARLHQRWALRAGIDYQMLQANHNGNLVLLATDASGAAVLDTVPVQFATNAWLGTLAGEVGARTLGDFWLTGGGGVGYMSTGFDNLGDYVSPDLLLAVPVAMKSGWGWEWTAAARYDFQPVPEAPLGVEVRMTSLRRGSDDVQLWMIRLCYRVPDLPRSRGPDGRDWR